MNDPEDDVPKVLLVDDDIELCNLHKEYLEAEGFSVALAFDGRSGVDAVLHGAPTDRAPSDRPLDPVDIVVLDVMMPGLDGIETLRRIRRQSDVPVLMLTARGDDIDRVVGLELGADDYVAKPCTPRELVARIRAILRRGARSEKTTDALTAGDLRLELATRRASWQGRPLDLTSTEFNLLATLAQRAGRVVSKEELSQQALGRALARYDRSIDVHLSHLRAKLGELPDGRSPIQTVRGFGYQWAGD